MSSILIDLYNLKQDVIIDDLPDGWRESLNRFLFGSTVGITDDGRHIAWYRDYKMWYYENQIAIERESKINNII